MDPSEAIGLASLVVLLILSGYFSSAETALTTVNKIRVRNLVEDKVKNADIVQKLIEDQSRLIGAILVGNNIVNLSASALTTYLVTKKFGTGWLGLATGILTLIVLIFGEIMPKTTATVRAEKLALRYAPSIYVLTRILAPIVFVLNSISRCFMKLAHIDPDQTEAQITEDELLTVVEVSHEEGVIENEERVMINNVVDFGDAIAKDVMVPRVEMKAVPDDITYNELMSAFEEDKFSRIPVYSESIDNIIGVVYLKDFCFYQGAKKDFDVKQMLREAHFTYEFKKTSELLVEMRVGTYSVAIVLDEYGSTAGLITLEDLLEEIVGEIRDEYDVDEVDDIQTVGKNDYIVMGTTKLEDFNEFFGTEYESDDYDSIAGHVINLFEHLPIEGETITEGDITFTVDVVDINRIDKLHVVVGNREPQIENEKQIKPEHK